MALIGHLRLNGLPWIATAGAAIVVGGGTTGGSTGSTGGNGSSGNTGNTGGNTGGGTTTPPVNTGGSPTTNPGGNITPGSYSVLSDIVYSQPEAFGQPVAGNGDNYKSVAALFGPVGGTGPFGYSIDNATFVSWNVTDNTAGNRSLGTVKHGWISAPGQ